MDDGQVTDARQAGHLPRMERIQGMWWRVVPPTPGNPEEWQLVVPEGFHDRILRAAHDSQPQEDRLLGVTLLLTVRHD